MKAPRERCREVEIGRGLCSRCNRVEPSARPRHVVTVSCGCYLHLCDDCQASDTMEHWKQSYVALHTKLNARGQRACLNCTCTGA